MAGRKQSEARNIAIKLNLKTYEGRPHKCGTTQKYLGGACVKCMKDYGNNRLRIYDITEEQYNVLLAKQKNSCAGCQKLFVHTPYIDHCHKTKKVRGLLCQRCNSALGFVNDNVNTLKRLIDYIS